MASKKLIAFLSKAIFLPSSLISKGSVTTPIMVKVVIKTATVVIEAPAFMNDAASGKATIEGMYKMAPARADPTMPTIPE